MALFGKDIGIDLGTVNVLVSEGGEIVLHEPCVVAIRVDEQKIVSIGPTATFSLGRENYTGLNKVEPCDAISNGLILAYKYLIDSDGFRKYVHEQAFLYSAKNFLNAIKELIPTIEIDHIEKSQKVAFFLKEKLLKR